MDSSLRSIASELFELNKAEDGIIVVNGHEEIIMANTTVETILGFTLDEILGNPLSRFLNSDRSCILQHLRIGKASEGNAFFSSHAGDTLQIHYSFLPVTGSNGLNGGILTIQSPSENTRIQHKFDSKYFFKLNIIGVAYVDLKNKILDANDAFLKMMGYSREDFEEGDFGWRRLIPEGNEPVVEAVIRQLREDRVFGPMEQQYIRKDGQRIDTLVGGGLIEGSDEICIAFFTDISIQKRAERASIEGEKLFRTMADSSKMMIWFITPEQRLHYLNKTVTDFVGVPFDEWPGFEPYIHPDDLPHTFELLKNAFATKGYYENVLRLRRADGMYRWILCSGDPVISESGEFLGYVGTGVDIHDLKEAQAELTDYTHRLEQSNQELERFATIASHDLQEPLRKIKMFSDHLKITLLDATASTESIDDLDRIQRATTKMQRLINDLLDLSRITRRGNPFRKVEIHEIAKEVVAELSYNFKNIRKQVTLSGTITLDADSNQIHQMLAQLLENALKFHKRGEPSSVNINIRPFPPNHCQISITDTGIGIKREHLERIFEPFTRLHHGTEYPGTGIGLALAKKIVERHRGEITATSDPEKGSTFTVTLPLSQD